jgi:transposase
LSLTDGFRLASQAQIVEQKKETLTLSERVCDCGHCGFTIASDLNAAINLSKTVS